MLQRSYQLIQQGQISVLYNQNTVIERDTKCRRRMLKGQ